ncbi:MAG TPA: glycerate kinase [Mycobacteriales bacterium]|nr:glycerate kinase [Mycobacteriales bacterium]
MRRVRVLLAPDSFGGTLTALQAADALAAGWRAARPGDELVLQPLSDGGPGFLDALPGTRIAVLVEDPLARPTLAAYLLDGTTAYVEAAQAAGLQLLDPDRRDPATTTTFGVGQLVLAAAEAGATRVVVGLGGTATNDGGAGLLAALGLHRADAQGGQLSPGGLALTRTARLTGRPPALELVAATDVDNPLLGPSGASEAFGPQKGAGPELVAALEAALTHWADVVEAHLRVRVRDAAGAGAAGGLGFALLALGATRVPGLDVVAAAVGLDDRIAGADLIVTGEGRLDGSSTRGKVVGGVARRALEHGVPCVAVAGEVLLGRREAGAAGLAQTYALLEHAPDRARSDPAAVVSEVAAEVARRWSVAH